MGFLLNPLGFSFHSSDITTRHHISNRLIFITFFAVAFTLQIYGVAAAVDQSEPQDAELQSSCETKTLDDVPPDPVSSFADDDDGQRKLVYDEMSFLGSQFTKILCVHTPFNYQIFYFSSMTHLT